MIEIRLCKLLAYNGICLINSYYAALFKTNNISIYYTNIISLFTFGT
jgi:hypothetical protein